MNARSRCRRGACIPDLKGPRRRWRKSVLYKCLICGEWFAWTPPKVKVQGRRQEGTQGPRDGAEC